MSSERFGPAQRARLEELQQLRPSSQTLAWNEVTRIDAERLWWEMGNLDRDALMVLLARALDWVPVDRFERVLGEYVHAGSVGATSDRPCESVLTAVDRFCRLAKHGYFYETMEYRGSQQPRGTEHFSAWFSFLLDQCVDEACGADPRGAVAAFELLLDLMRHIDVDPDAIVFFTDEPGSWQLHVNWVRVLPAYFSAIAHTLDQQEYLARVEAVQRDFGHDVDPRMHIGTLADEALATWSDAPRGASLGK